MKRATHTLTVLAVACALAAAPFASADNITELQNQLRTVMQNINNLKGQLSAMDGPAVSSGSCPRLGRLLRRGMRGNDVAALQSFLAKDANIYPEGVVGGYFGFATERAVQRFQERHGIAAYGDMNTTGYGMVGARTRAVISSICEGTTPVTPGGTNSANVVTFDFAQSTGQAPFNANLKFQVLEAPCVSYSIDWGDNSDPLTYEAVQSSNCGTGMTERNVQHTFKNSGSYVVALRAQKGSGSNMPLLVKRTVTVDKGEPYVAVTKPAAGGNVRLGEYTKIAWDTGNYPSDSAIAFYMVGPSETYSFAKRSMRTSEFDWIVGDRVCDGNSCDVQMPTGQYKIRAVMYTPADGCIDFCNADDTQAKTVVVSESGPFTVSSLGTSGGAPITISNASGIAPLTINVHVELAPTSTGSNFEVDFGDNSQKYTIHVPVGETRSTTRDITHTYTKTGTYSVALRPAGAVQNIGVAMLNVNAPKFVVLPKEGAYAPATISATFDVDTSCVPQGSSTAARRYTVDWGDNSETSVHEVTPAACGGVVPGPQVISQKTFSHPYTDSGGHTVKLSVSNGAVSYQASSTVNLGSTTYTVSPSFFTDPPYNTTASFKADQSCSAAGGATATYTVDWGDSTTPSTYSVNLPACGATFTPVIVDKTLTHTFPRTGNFTTKLTVSRTDVPGGSLTRTKDVVVDTSATSFLWHRMQAVFNGDESLTASANLAASAFYQIVSGDK